MLAQRAALNLTPLHRGITGRDTGLGEQSVGLFSMRRIAPTLYGANVRSGTRLRMNLAPASSDLPECPETSEEIAEFEAIVGRERVLSDAASLNLYGMDILGALATPLAVIRPASATQICAVVEHCARHGIAIYPRGGGASYTHSHVPAVDRSIVMDTADLNSIVEVNQDDLTVTVEPGVTWHELDKALAPLGLRTAVWGPHSGKHSTIGGSLSQHAIGWGSAAYDASNSIVTGLQIVSGTGELIDVGATKSRFYQTYGPDLCALFAGDSGAFGIKVQITLRLMERPQHVEACTFVYEGFADMAVAMMAAAKRNVACDILSIDPVLQRGQLGSVDASAMLSTARAIFRSSPSFWSGAKALSRALFGNRKMLRQKGFLCNFLTEGVSATEAKAKLASLREVVSTGGTEIANTMALALHAEPFRDLNPVLGPGGERWWPMHGVLSFSQVMPFHRKLMDLYAELADQMEAHGVYLAHMYLTVGSNAFVYEPTLYWPDSQHAVHRHFVPDETLAGLATHPEAPEARALAKEVKRRIVSLFSEHDAAHYQIGKSYPYFTSRTGGAKNLLTAIKRELDPHSLFCPGALEFPYEGAQV